MITLQTLDSFVSQVKAMPGQWHEERIEPWRFRLRFEDDVWTLAMRLHPYGRSGSTTADWKLSGQIVGSIGRASGHNDASLLPIENLEATHPNETLHWTWPRPSMPAVRLTNGPVNALPNGWTARPFIANSVVGLQYESADGLRVIVTDEPMKLGVGLVACRHISASHRLHPIRVDQIELVRCLFAFPGQETMGDSINPNTGVWHLWQARHDEFSMEQSQCRD